MAKHQNQKESSDRVYIYYEGLTKNLLKKNECDVEGNLKKKPHDWSK